MQWGYSPKLERYIPLADFSPEIYMVTCLQAFENLGWSISHISKTSIIAYTPLSWQSYNEEVSVQISAGFAIVKSECLGIQLLFTDYGKNEKNLEDFFHEFDYVEFHLNGVWDERIHEFREITEKVTGGYFEHSPLAVKNKIRNVFYLFIPRKGYYVTPILIILNIFWFVSSILLITGMMQDVRAGDLTAFSDSRHNPYIMMGANNRYLTLSGEYWRLVTHIFVHFGLAHLFFNMYALTYIGLMTENKTGSGKFLATFILSGIVGGAVSLVYHPVGVMAGASGAIMGMFGLFLALLVTDVFESNARRALSISTVLVIGIMLLNGIFGRTDNAAHMGGVIAGFVTGLVFTFKISEPDRWSEIFSYVTATLIVGVFTINLLYYTPNYEVQKFEKMVKLFILNQQRAQNIYRYRQGVTKAQSLERIRTYGIESWQENYRISKGMTRLTLPEDAARRAARMHEFSKLQLQMISLLYKERRDETNRYRTEIKAVHRQINEVLLQQFNEE